jgi:monoamine oxidase
MNVKVTNVAEAAKFFYENTDQATEKVVRECVKAKTHRWVTDPWVDGCWGLLDSATDLALVLVFGNGHPDASSWGADFETTEELDELVIWP